ncbi:MAG: beta-mannosidase [Actinomycetota bacterium]
MLRSPDAVETTPVTDGVVGATAPGAATTPDALNGLTWLPARVPGTVAGALRAAGEDPLDGRDLDADDWWFRTQLGAAPPTDGEEVSLRLDGIATIADVFLDGAPVLQSDSMFLAHSLDVSARVRDGARLDICCRALAPVIAESRTPRARWRTKLAAGGLRHVRTMLLGRSPGFAPGPAAVGPWRPIVLERRRHVAVDDLRVRARLDGTAGRVSVAATLRPIGGAIVRAATITVAGPTGEASSELTLAHRPGGHIATGEVAVTGAATWWPHTHGEPSLYDVRVRVETDTGTVEVDGGRVGFRSLEPGGDGHRVDVDGLDLRVNGVRVFARGAVWTPLDIVSLVAGEDELRRTLERVRDAGMNMVRVPGTSAYETPAFHDLCDELGILVWQDFMFANFDYPIADDDFRRSVEAEARTVLDDLAPRPSTAVLCGGSEVEQQATMFGRPPSEARGELFGELLPSLVATADIDASYVPSSPCGGDLPFHPGQGIANYYGVGGYRRPFSDVRLADVKFAGECLALANLPDDDALADVGVPRDVGADWDFADVRDHYVGVLYDVDVDALRASQPHHLLELGRAASGEVMATVFGEWRRAASSCGGGLVLWLEDLYPGAGWGVLDDSGEPKVAYHHLRRVLAPIAVWLTDEGLGGLDVHVANDGSAPLAAQLRVAFYRDGETLVDELVEPVELAAHTVERRGVEAMLGRFVDASYAYRFGPPAFDVVVASLERPAEGGLVSQAFAFPAGRPAAVEPVDRLGLTATARRVDRDVVVTVASTRLAHGVRLHLPGFAPGDDAFSIEPGRSRTVVCRPTEPALTGTTTVTAINMEGVIDVVVEPGA